MNTETKNKLNKTRETVCDIIQECLHYLQNTNTPLSSNQERCLGRYMFGLIQCHNMLNYHKMCIEDEQLPCSTESKIREDQMGLDIIRDTQEEVRVVINKLINTPNVLKHCPATTPMF